jgi:membrane protein CcdC involved in cytochrome C biogenesis
MAQPGTPQALVTVAIVALIAWRLYSRIRRNIGRQRLSPVRPWITLTVFPLILTLLALNAHLPALGSAALAGGVVVGVALGIFGLRLTRFEATAQGVYYTPNAHLGILLSTLVVCRVVYRLIVGGLPGTAAAPAPPPTLTPLTLLLLGTLAGYYCTYAIGLLRWARSSRAAGSAAP